MIIKKLYLFLLCILKDQNILWCCFFFVVHDRCEMTTKLQIKYKFLSFFWKIIINYNFLITNFSSLVFFWPLITQLVHWFYKIMVHKFRRANSIPRPIVVYSLQSRSVLLILKKSDSFLSLKTLSYL